jgi:hypothetical protein
MGSWSAHNQNVFKEITMTYPMQHTDLDQMICEHHDVPGQDLECYFEAYTGSLWFVYVNGGEIHELLRDSVIQTLEAAYAKACKEEAEEQKLSAALDRYYQKTGVIL